MADRPRGSLRLPSLAAGLALLIPAGAVEAHQVAPATVASGPHKTQGLATLTADAGRPAPRVTRVFTIRSPAIPESSSLAVSTVAPRLVYTTNDSGDAATVYVLRSRDGVLVGRTTLSGVAAVDVEALSAGADGTLVVADIGDNEAERRNVRLYRIAQPRPGRQRVRPDLVIASYADGPRDAESVVYDAASGRVFVVSKELLGGAVYVSPPGTFSRPRVRLRPVASAPAVATDATALPRGGFVVIRTYTSATVFRLPGWRPVRRFPLPAQRQGESITAPPGDAVVWAGSEGLPSPVLAVRLPSLPEARSRPSGAPDDAGQAENGRARSPDLTVVAWATLLGCGGAALVAGLVLVRRLRSR